jgi:hypothetical protein
MNSHTAFGAKLQHASQNPVPVTAKTAHDPKPVKMTAEEKKALADAQRAAEQKASADQAAAGQLLQVMFPLLEAMTELELKLILTQLDMRRGLTICPYSGEEFDSEHLMYVTQDVDGFRVGTEEYMAMCALCDRTVHAPFDAFYTRVDQPYQAMVDARVMEEARIETERQHRQDLIDQVSRLAKMLDRIHEVEGREMTQQAFDETLIKTIAPAHAITDEAILFYLDDRSKRRGGQNTAVSRQDAPSEMQAAVAAFEALDNSEVHA